MGPESIKCSYLYNGTNWKKSLLNYKADLQEELPAEEEAPDVAATEGEAATKK